MRFELDNQQVKASLLGTQATHSQYLISNIKAGDYTLTMDAENLPLEYSTGKLLTPRIRVSNYAPTSVPIQLEKSYGVSGKLADAKEGVVIDIYQGATLIQSVTTGSYGYFQTFGLAPNTYRLKAKGYEAVSIEVTDNFVMQLLLQPLQLQKAL
jgi:poly-gamma-glutamate capsule biosynthesis protein CapA/YwtB (metallophosphatase superfamily)